MDIARRVYRCLHELCIVQDLSGKAFSEILRDYSSFLGSFNEPECAVKLYESYHAMVEKKYGAKDPNIL
jgi:hypothetical protein